MIRTPRVETNDEYRYVVLLFFWGWRIRDHKLFRLTREKHDRGIDIQRLPCRCRIHSSHPAIAEQLQIGRAHV